MLDLIQVGGAAARTLAVLEPPFPEESVATEQLIRALESGIASHHGSAGPMLCQMLCRKPSLREKLAELFDTHAERLASIAPPGAFAARAVKYLASLLVAYDMLGKLDIPRPAEITPILDVAWGALNSSTAAADLETGALRHAYYAAKSREEAFWWRHIEDPDGPARPPVRGWHGARPSEDCFPHLARYPPQLKAELRRAGFVPEAILRGWKRRGWVKIDEGHQTAFVSLPSAAGARRERMVCILRPALVTAGLVDSARPLTAQRLLFDEMSPPPSDDDLWSPEA